MQKRKDGITFEVNTFWGGGRGEGLGSPPGNLGIFACSPFHSSPLSLYALEEQANRLPCPIATVQEKTVPILQFYILIKDYYKFTNVLFVH